MTKSALSSAAVLAVLPQWSWVLSLIFMGCCSNAYYLEQATRIQPACGTLMTFLHFLFTTLQVLPTQVVWGGTDKGKQSNGKDKATSKTSRISQWVPRLRKPAIPLMRWAFQVVLYFGTSILNNSAFSFHVPVPVHIIFRSGGLVVSMLIGYLLKGRRYSLLQIISVILVTGGVITSTLATTPPDVDAGSSSSVRPGSMSPATEYFCGIAMLTLALFLSALMGLYQETTYATYGSQHWQEGLFYNHFLSLPLFALRYKTLSHEWNLAFAGKRSWIGWGTPGVNDHARALRFGKMATTEGKTSLLSSDAIWNLKELILPSAWLVSRRLFTPPQSLPTQLASSFGILVPSLFPALTLNVLAQLLCINGVNRLTAMCSSLTVTLVLVVRKAVSLAISVLIIAPAQGEEVQGKGMLAIGATSVLVGTIGYTFASAQQQGASSKPSSKKTSGVSPDNEQTPRGSSSAIAEKRGQARKR